MKKANIVYARNNLSKLIAQVKEGEAVLIMDRLQPVARLEQVGNLPISAPHQLNGLVRSGIIRPPARKLNLKILQNAPPEAGDDIVKILASEREERL